MPNRGTNDRRPKVAAAPLAESTRRDTRSRSLQRMVRRSVGLGRDVEKESGRHGYRVNPPKWGADRPSRGTDGPSGGTDGSSGGTDGPSGGTDGPSGGTAGSSEDAAERVLGAAFVHGSDARTPNDPKLSDCGARRAGCGKVAGVGWAQAAGWCAAASVTRGAVRCSAWLGAPFICAKRAARCCPCINREVEYQPFLHLPS